MSMPSQPSSYDDALATLEEAERLKLSCEYEASIALLEALLSRDPGNVAALEEIADNELSLERYERAVTAAKQAVALDDKSYMGHYVLGFALTLKGEWKKAEEELTEANRIRPHNAEILRCLGWSLFQRGDKVRGIVTLERALNLDTENVLILCDLGVCYLEVRNLRKAQVLFERAQTVDPKSERAQECAAMVDRMKSV